MKDYEHPVTSLEERRPEIDRDKKRDEVFKTLIPLKNPNIYIPKKEEKEIIH